MQVNKKQNLADSRPRLINLFGRNQLKFIALYATMVVVSTITIFVFEHTSLLNAFRTALIAAIGKTIAANWVAGVFD